MRWDRGASGWDEAFYLSDGYPNPNNDYPNSYYPLVRASSSWPLEGGPRMADGGGYRGNPKLEHGQGLVNY